MCCIILNVKINVKPRNKFKLYMPKHKQKWEQKQKNELQYTQKRKYIIFQIEINFEKN